MVHPRTPNPYDDISKRCFDGQIKAWRRELHKWDNMEQSLHNSSDAVQTIKVSAATDETSDGKLLTNSESEKKIVEEELCQDDYKSDGETFDAEDIL